MADVLTRNVDGWTWDIGRFTGNAGTEVGGDARRRRAKGRRGTVASGDAIRA